MHSSRSGGAQGMTLIEAAVSLSLIALTVMPIVSLLVTSRRSVGDSRTHTLARTAAASQIDRLRARAYQGEAAFAGLAAEIAAAPTFAVPGLPARQGGLPQGRITAILDEGDLDGVPDANTVELDLSVTPGVGLDIDASGGENDVGVAGEYWLIPVQVEVRWGIPESVIRLDTVIAPRNDFRRSD